MTVYLYVCVCGYVYDKQVITCGFTPHPPHPKLEKTAFSAVLNVPSRHYDRTTDGIQELKKKGYQVRWGR